MAEGETFSFKSIGMLLRLVAVVASSVATIISTLLPLIFRYDVPNMDLFLLFILLTVGALLIHGGLTHVFNDITDYHSGTDAHSPGLLSGGSRVIQTGAMSLENLKWIGIVVSALLLMAALLFVVFDYFVLAILVMVGIWGAATYSLRPFRLAYHPFAGEWISLFPSMLVLGLAAPWIMLESIPLWGWQNALINALWCMAWVMVHHIPDIDADRRADPIKRTSVVWAADRFGIAAARLPALLYLGLIGLIAVWLLADRPVAAIGVIVMLVYAIWLIVRMNVKDAVEVTNNEKLLLLIAMATAVWLGIFV